MADQAIAKPELQEIATTRDGRDITRSYVDALQQLVPQDAVLMLRGGGNYEIYREVLRDDQVAATFAQRRLAVVSREVEVVAGGKRAADKNAAAFLKEQIDGLNFDAVTDLMLFGRFYGYSVAECMWAYEGRYVTLPEIRVRDRRRFAFDGDFRLRLMTMQNIMPGELMPDRRFWTFATGADHDDEPYGLGLAHWLYWPVFFKRNGIKFWLVFLEKFGQPTAKGEYPANAQAAEKTKLLAALSAIATDAGVIVPEGMQIELLEAARSGTADYTALYDRMNAAISKVVLGHTGTSEATPGKLGSEQAAQEALDRLAKADADLVCSSFNAGPATWLTEWNFPGAAPPRIWRKMDEAEDLNAVAERDAKLAQIGFVPTPERVKEVYGDGYEVKAPPAPNMRQAINPPPQFAEADPAGIDPNLARIDAAARPAVEKWLEQVRAIADAATDLPDLAKRLDAAFGELQADEFAAVMREALTAKNLQGRADVEAE